MNDDSPSFSRTVGFFLLGEGLVILGLALLSQPGVLSGLFGADLDPFETMQVRYAQLGLFCVGCFTCTWGLYEIFFKREGPLILLLVLCSVPLHVPFGSLGFGSDPQSWMNAYAAENGVGGSSAAPLFGILARGLVPSTGWTGLFVANLITGIAGALILLLIPLGKSASRAPLLAASVLVHPVYLLAMATGREGIWQTLCVSMSAVLLLRGLGDPPRFGLLILSAIVFGIAAGFQKSGLAMLPIFLAVLFFGVPQLRAAILGMALYGFAALATFAVAGTIAEELFQSTFLSLPTDPVMPGAGSYSLARFLLPAPALLLLLVGLIGVALQWRRFDSPSRLLVGLSIGALLVLVPGFLKAPSGPTALALAVPFAAIVWTFGAPRMVTALFIPILAISGFASIDWMSRGPEGGYEVRLNADRGPLVEEVDRRFHNLRRVQQILLIAPKERTAVIVGDDWPIVATLRPDWKMEKGELRNPDRPVGFHDSIPKDDYNRMTEEGIRILVVPGAEIRTENLYGYDPLALGATPWDPKRIYYQ